jgi:hypothetical protein
MAAIDNFASFAPGLDSPATLAEAVTPHDTNELTNVSRGLWVGGAGDVAVVTSGGSTATFAAVPAGTMLPVRAKIVKTTGTTASSIVAVS